MCIRDRDRAVYHVWKEKSLFHYNFMGQVFRCETKVKSYLCFQIKRLMVRLDLSLQPLTIKEAKYLTKQQTKSLHYTMLNFGEA